MNKDSINKIILKPVNWLNDDPDGDNIILSSRIRLARNIAKINFPNNSNDTERKQVLDMVMTAVEKVKGFDFFDKLDISEISDLDKKALLERKLISNKLTSSEIKYSCLILDNLDKYHLLVNEEDHLRIQVIDGGLKLRQIWKEINKFDTDLEEFIPFAFDSSLGFLTSSPANVGTGIKASVMLNLPGLVIANQISTVIKGINKLGLAINGLYDESTSYIGNLYQISNQSTLGEMEEQIIERIENIVDQIVIHEKNARLNLLDTKKEYLLNYIGRAYGIMRYSYIISEKEALDYLSVLRMGIDLKMFSNLTYSALNDLIISVQNANLQKLTGISLSLSDLDILRADIIRNKLQNNIS